MTPYFWVAAGWVMAQLAAARMMPVALGAVDTADEPRAESAAELDRGGAAAEAGEEVRRDRDEAVGRHLVGHAAHPGREPEDLVDHHDDRRLRWRVEGYTTHAMIESAEPGSMAMVTHSP